MLEANLAEYLSVGYMKEIPNNTFLGSYTLSVPLFRTELTCNPPVLSYLSSTLLETDKRVQELFINGLY